MRRSAPLILTFAAVLASGAAFAQAPQAPAVPKKATNGFGPKSKQEGEAVNKVIQAQTGSPDDMIAAVDALLGKFADTVYKSFALELEAEAYQRKNDNAKAIVFGEQALAADPKNFDADNLLANILSQTTRDTDLDKDEKLSRADKYAHDSLEALEAGKPPMYSNLTDDQWNKMKAPATALAWQALGSSAVVRKRTDEAVADFEKGIAANPDPLLMIRAGRALLAARKYDEAIGYFDKVIADDKAAAQIKNIATADKNRAVQAKGPAK